MSATRTMTITRASGFGLVELMIAMTLGLLLTAAVLQTFVAARASYRVQGALSEVQEASRYAVHFLGKDIRMAGYMGCASLDTVAVNIIAKDPPADVLFDLDTVLVGSDNVAEGNALGAVPGTDTVTVRRASTESAQLTGNMWADNAQIHIVDNGIGLVKDDLLLITDCLDADLFRATTVSRPETGKVNITHASDGNTTPKLSKAYGPDAEIFGFESINYFVADTGRDTAGGNDIRALFVQRRTLGSGGAAPTAVELIEGVENMQISYGEDTDGDQAIDRYVSAAAVGDWAGVLSMRVELLLVGSEEGVVGRSGAGDAQVVTFANATVANNDGRYRRAIVNVFAIRNKLP